MTSTAVIILNWNGIDDTLQCLQSLKSQTHKAFMVVVVDNGSSVDSVDELQKIDDKNVTVLYNQTNLGFAGGVNIGIRWAIKNDYSHVALLNNDATVDSNWLEQLHNSARQHSDAGIITSLILHEDKKTIDSTGDFYTTWGIPSPRLRDEKTENTPDSAYVFGASGGASLYRVEMLKTIGLFDENFFAYYEDVDISFRAQLSGFKVFYEKSAVVYHKQGATSSKISGFTTYHAFKNLPLLFIKNVPLSLLFPIGIRFFVIYTLMLVNALRRGDGRYALKGWLMSIYFTWKTSIWQRRNIQQKKIVSSRYMNSIIVHDLPPKSSLRKLKSIFN